MLQAFAHPKPRKAQGKWQKVDRKALDSFFALEDLEVFELNGSLVFGIWGFSGSHAMNVH